VNPTVREHLIARLSQKGVKVITGVKYREINKRGIEILTKDGVCETIEADTVVLAAGSVPEIEIYRSIKDKFPNVQVIGDSNKPGNIMGAVSDGFFSALNI
jgi:NADH dehydrogenase FAD-containing subunit